MTMLPYYIASFIALRGTVVPDPAAHARYLKEHGMTNDLTSMNEEGFIGPKGWD